MPRGRTTAEEPHTRLSFAPVAATPFDNARLSEPACAGV